MALKTAEQSSADRTSGFWTDIRTIPNLMSISRILITLVAAGLYLHEYRAAGLIIGAAAGVTDILDGWLARKLNQSTELGAVLDRLSDLVLETVALTLAIHNNLLPPSFLIIYLTREWIVISARQYVAERGQSIPSSFLGKRKTNLVLGSFIGVFAADAGLVSGDAGYFVWQIGYMLMVGGLIASYLSGIIYLRSFIEIYDADSSS
jgi:cardiolipin synthase